MSSESQFTPTGRRGRPQKYQLLMELGRGGMGVVHLAMARGPQSFVKLVVLKMLKAQLLGDDLAQRMFMEEARISARLAHPNIVQVYEVFEYDGLPTMVMEYLEGQPLYSIIGDEPASLSRPMHLHVISKLLAGLHAAHELRDYDGRPLNLMHRDVSPHNVFVLYDGQVKVLDFGIAKAAGSEVHTLTGELKGKIRYMAPEQLAGGENQDRRVDIFSAGVMLWEALAGRRLWADMAEGDVMLSLLTDKVPALPASANVPAPLVAISNKALAVDPEQRYATAAEFQRDLDRYLLEQPDYCTTEQLSSFMLHHFGELREATNKVVDSHIKAADRASARPPPDEPSDTVIIKPPAKQRRSKVLAAAAGLGLVLLTGIGVLLATRGSDPEPARPAASRARPAGPAALACGGGFKACDGECVSVERPDYGCGASGCGSCVVTNATARCNAQRACDIAVCYQDFDNCDGDPDNGCEANVRIDPDNCGSCGRKCPDLPNAKRGCGDSCTIWRCESGFRDCNGETSDGCEVAVLANPKHCGHCGLSCPPGQACRNGRCGG